jgi:hypothetical protein
MRQLCGGRAAEEQSRSAGQECGIAADKLAIKAHERLAVDWSTVQCLRRDWTVIECPCFVDAEIEDRAEPVLFSVLRSVAVAPTVLRAVLMAKLSRVIPICLRKY